MAQSEGGTGAAFSTVQGTAAEEAEERVDGALGSVLPRTSQNGAPAVAVEGEVAGGVVRAVRRVGRWWLQHWLQYAEAVGAQWR